MDGDLFMLAHPSANIWPLMTDVELDALATDIADRGQVLPIIMVGGLILDGRNRWLACQRAGIEPWLEETETDDPDALAWSLNEHRRHANEGVRIMAAARRETLKLGDNQHRSIDLPSQAEIANQFGISTASLKRGKVVLDHGDTAIIDAVENDDLAVALAAKAVRRIQETGEGFGSIAELKKTMRDVFREENPSPPAPARKPQTAIDHLPLDTFGIINSLVRHAKTHPAPGVAASLDKWTRLAVLDDLPHAIDYLTELQTILIREAQA